MIYPLVRELAVEGIPVTVTWRALGFSRQAFYEWDANPVSQRDWDDAHLVNAILNVHGDDPEFGYRFIADELAADPSVVEASENRIWRLCRANGVASVITIRKGSGKTPARRSTTTTSTPVPRDTPNQLWLADITEHRTAEGKLYACMIKDCYSPRGRGPSAAVRRRPKSATFCGHPRRRPVPGFPETGL